jgi:hypothetical protein
MTFPPPPGQPPAGSPSGEGQYPPATQPYAPPVYQQPQYGQPQHGQSQYGQSQYGAPPYPPQGQFPQPPAGYGSAPPARRLSEPLVGWLLVGVAALTMIAAALPWATVLTISVAGTAADGRLTIGCGVILAGLGVLIGVGRGALWVSITACVIGTVVTLIALADVGSVSSIARHGTAAFLADEDVSVGGGLWLTVLAGFAALALSIVAMARRRVRPAQPSGQPS